MSASYPKPGSGRGIRTVLLPGVEVPARAVIAAAEPVLTREAVTLVADLQRRFGPERERLLEARKERQRAYDAGDTPGYLDRNSEAASGSWKVAPIPQDLLCRRVEITGPVNSAKMVINMLGRGADGARADCAMVDFEDALKPSWANIIDGMNNVKAVARGKLEHVDAARAGRPEKVYRLNPDDSAVMIVRPRGLHLTETNFVVDGKPVSASLFDLGLSFLHAAPDLIRRGKTPAYYIPKCEHHLEARWWNSVFSWLEDRLHVQKGTLKATFLIETLPAAYQMEEILFEIREHAAGLNVGRWDKIFSDIKTLRHHKDRVLADRGSITMLQPWMAAYARRCVQICHGRGAFGMGGMAAFTPGKTKEIRDAQIAKVVADKQHEASIGHDGCWVSHPYFIGPAMTAFTRKNQLDVLHAGEDKYPDLLPKPIGPKTLGGLRTNVRVGIGYMEGWRRDIGCVAWDNLMEDLATLEISRAQTWQWMHHQIALDDGPSVTPDLVRRVFREELDRIIEKESADFAAERGVARKEVIQSFEAATKTAEEIFTRKDFQDFLYMASDPVA
jgi:malate synthase